MLFKFNGNIPNKLEFTCKCSTWIVEELLLDSDEYTSDNPKIIECVGCKQRRILIWQQRTHWHLRIMRLESRGPSPSGGPTE